MGMLRHVLEGSTRIIYASHIENTAAELSALAKKYELEGVLGKHGSSRYVAGRSDRWLKIKTVAGAERESKRRPR